MELLHMKKSLFVNNRVTIRRVEPYYWKNGAPNNEATSNNKRSALTNTNSPFSNLKEDSDKRVYKRVRFE